MTTTLAAIRDEQIATVQALTPKSLASVKFRVALEERDFREWAQAEPVAAFRRFAIVDSWRYEVPTVHGGDMCFEPAHVAVVVAYPRDYRYGPGNRRDMRDVMREDREQIDYAIGAWGTGNYTSSSAVLEATSYEEYESVVLLVLELRVFFYRSTSGEAVLAYTTEMHEWAAHQYSSQDVLTSSSAHVAVNLALGNEFYHNITEDSAVDNPTNIVAGMRWSLTVEADGSHELTWGTYYKWGGTTGVCPDFSAMSDGQLVAIDCKAHSATVILCAASETYTP